MRGNYIVSFSDSYHGTFYGGMSISGISKDIVKNHNPNYDNRLTLKCQVILKKKKIYNIYRKMT